LRFNGFDPHGATPYLQSWNFTVEKGLGSAAALELSYVGSKGTHLSRSSDINQPYYDGRRQPNGAFPRRYPSVGNTIN
jgi:hypothetical protein